MSARYFLPGSIWIIAMFLLFASPIGESHTLYFGCLPSRSLIHCIMFWGFAHLWLGAFKKQNKFDFFKRNAFMVVLLCGIVLSFIAETLMYFLGTPMIYGLWNFFFDLVGVGLGMLTFRLLYASCY